MTTDTTLTLRYTPDQVAQFCRHLALHAPGSEQQLAALTTLQSFIAAGADAGAQAGPTYQAILLTLQQAQDQARATLLQRNVERLAAALRQQDVVAIATLYRPLSRSGFWEVLTHAASGFDGAAQTALAQWAQAWVSDAKQRGEQASGFPDAIDFHKAGIDVVEYNAMSDIQRYTEGLLR